jgi:hypothetical protein
MLFLKENSGCDKTERYTCIVYCIDIASRWFLMTGLLFFAPFYIAAQGPIAYGAKEPSMDRIDPVEDPLNENYDEILITLNVRYIGSTELTAIIKGETAYLPVKELFEFLKIRNLASPDMDTIHGFVADPAATYLIDRTNFRITYKEKSFELKESEIMRSSFDLYLRSDYFGLIFGLDCSFNFRSLSVNLSSKTELPAMRELRLESMRRNVSRMKGEKKADSVINRGFPMFSLGMADWSVIRTEMTGQEKRTGNNTRANLALGGMIAGGETNVYLNYNSLETFTPKRQYVRWRYVNNDNKIIRQVAAGTIFPQSISSVFVPILGVQFSNTPTTYRRSFGSYTLSDHTEPGWVVELYINNILIDYTKADGSGFFTFEVPMIYGNTDVKLRFYGPWGEERTSEHSIIIPFNFMPQGQLEYNLTGGILSDQYKSIYSKASFNYGLSKRITMGGGMEYLSSLPSGQSIPFVNASIRLGSRLFVSGEHANGVRSKAILNLRLPFNLQLDINYSKYSRTQKAVRFNYLEEKKIAFSFPIRSGRFFAFSRLTINEFTLPESSLRTAEFLTSGAIAGVNSNLTTLAIFSEPGNPLVFSNLSLTFRLPAGIRLRPQVQYEYKQKDFSMLKCDLEKSIFHRGFLNVSFEKDNISKTHSFGIGLRYNFSFAQTSFTAVKNTFSTTMMQSARGSLLYDNKTKSLNMNNQSQAGKGGLIITPFLDLNCNGKKEAHEPRVAGLKFRINGGTVKRNNNRDTSIHVIGLEAYASYLIELDKNSFDNVSWHLAKETINVVIDPNIYKQVLVPVKVEGEVSGTVFIKNDKGVNGQGRMIVNIYRNDSELVAKVLSEADGYYNFMGLVPGNYSVAIDPVQIKNLRMKVTDEKKYFTIRESIDGEVVEGVDFTLMSEDTVNKK